MTQDEKYMLRALQLAELGRGSVSPNPMVGCVIVHNGLIIGEGYHKKYGGPHAEVNALNSVDDQSLLSESTAYVSLEPCAHFGKTPPCANLLKSKKIKRVVIGTMDSNPEVGGKGVKILEDAGIEVIKDVFEGKARDLNRRFFTQIEKKRPYIILKWAQTLDGFVARDDYSSKWISNSSSRMLVHKWRSEEDAIMVGKNTAVFDNPRLNVRDWKGKDPVRIVIDPKLELSDDIHLFDGSIPTLRYNTQESKIGENLEWVKLQENFEVSDLLEDLYIRKIQSVLVEGGAYLLKKFISSELWDEARVFTGTSRFSSGISAPVMPKPGIEQQDIDGDTLTMYRNV